MFFFEFSFRQEMEYVHGQYRLDQIFGPAGAQVAGWGDLLLPRLFDGGSAQLDPALGVHAQHVDLLFKLMLKHISILNKTFPILLVIFGKFFSFSLDNENLFFNSF